MGSQTGTPATGTGQATFEISYSELNAFFTCPARYQYMRRWRTATLDKALQDGIHAHALVAGQSVSEASPRARWFAARLAKLERGYTLPAEYREIYEKVPWVEGIVFKRILDARGWAKKTPVLVDYKTGTWPWEERSDIIAQALGFQATIYLLPPADPALRAPFTRKSGWPERLDFLTAPEKGPAAIYSYYRSTEDEANLLEAVQHVRETTRFPKNRGYACKTCAFFDLCYEVQAETGAVFLPRNGAVPVEER